MFSFCCLLYVSLSYSIIRASDCCSILAAVSFQLIPCIFYRSVLIDIFCLCLMGMQAVISLALNCFSFMMQAPTLLFVRLPVPWLPTSFFGYHGLHNHNAAIADGWHHQQDTILRCTLTWQAHLARLMRMFLWLFCYNIPVTLLIEPKASNAHLGSLLERDSLTNKWTFHFTLSRKCITVQFTGRRSKPNLLGILKYFRIQKSLDAKISGTKDEKCLNKKQEQIPLVHLATNVREVSRNSYACESVVSVFEIMECNFLTLSNTHKSSWLFPIIANSIGVWGAIELATLLSGNRGQTCQHRVPFNIQKISTICQNTNKCAWMHLLQFPSYAERAHCRQSGEIHWPVKLCEHCARSTYSPLLDHQYTFFRASSVQHHAREMVLSTDVVSKRQWYGGEYCSFTQQAAPNIVPFITHI